MGAQVYPTQDNGHQDDAVKEKRHATRGKDMEGRPLVDIERGEKLGALSDLLFDPESLQVAALVSESGALFNREVEYFQAEQVEVWGKDVILVRRQGERSRTLPDRDRLLNLTDHLRGRPVVSTDGAKIGRIGDVLLDTNGQLAGYELSDVNVEGPLKKSKRIPVEAIQTLGKDVLIIDTNQL